MEWNRKKLWPAAVASLVAITSLLNAADDTQMRNLENRVSALEQRKGSNGMINPPARPVVKDGVDLYLQGDVFIWQASESDMGYAVKNEHGTSYVADGHVVRPHFEWDWGFKLAAGFNMPHDGWDLFLQWTRFYTDNNEHGVAANPGGTIFPTFVNAALQVGGTPAPVTSGFQGASSYWKLKLNLIDLELGREFYVSKWLTLRPFGGLRSAWLRQRYNVHYNNGTVGTAGGQNLSVNLRNNFWGMGLLGGIDGKWGLGNGFNICSDLASSILLGHFKITELERRITTSPYETRLNVQEKFRVARATLDMSLGFLFERTFADDRFGLMVKLAWEQHMFFDQNQLMKFPTSSSVAGQNYSGLFVSSDGDLSTQGVTLSVGFDF